MREMGDCHARATGKNHESWAVSQEKRTQSRFPKIYEGNTACQIRAVGANTRGKGMIKHGY